MCGINLIIDKKKDLSPELIHKMSALTHHRGPDETKIERIDSNTKTYFLASNRLKITDQSEAASQPYFSPDSKFALLFNGEIYNYHTLKNDLLSNDIRFSSHSDTEVLFHWLRLYGKSGIKKLKGMFALIFIDFEKDEILIARDRIGIKPIYYFEDENCFIASSEIKSIVGTGLVKKEINGPQVHHYLLYKYAKAPETLYQNVYELKHGSILHHQNNSWRNFTFWQNKNIIPDRVPDVEKIESLITNSLIQQLDAKVPLGLLLSGGVDSTLLLALARKEGFSVPTYSIVNSASDASFGTKDYHYSRLAASTYRSNHNEIEIDINILNQFQSFINSIDQPIGDSSFLMTSEVCKHASDSMKILLSGAGADELFAGYNRHRAFYDYLNNKKTIDQFLPLIKPLINILPTGTPHPLRKKFKLLKKWSNAHDKSPAITYDNYLKFNVLGLKDSEGLFTSYETDQEWFDFALKHDQNNYLVSDILALSDKASMLHGIELRVPYLDEDLINYQHDMAPSSLINRGQKWILKEILKKHGGKKFIHRPKEGFGLPLSNWLFDKRVVHLWELFESKESMIYNFIDKHIFDNLVKQQKRKAEDNGPLLWSILVLGHWLQRNF